ncbi:MAG: 3'(2'),5'-bisphosphate nucleotidase, partial [Planctomycetota bacterium]
MAYETERRVAIEAVIKACQLCRIVRAILVTDQTMAKKDKSPVTVADYGAQAVVSTELMRIFPCDPLVGEEDSGELRTKTGAVIKDRV